MFFKMVRHIFGLVPGEGAKVLGFAALGAFMQAGLAVGMSCADSMFLVHVGAAQLPIVYLLTPVVMVCYIAVFSTLLARIGIDRLFKYTLVFLVLGAVAFPFALEYAAGDAVWTTVLFYAAKLHTVLWYIALYTLFWNFVDGYFDILDAKRLYSYLAAGCALGAAAGGAVVSIMTEHIEVQRLFVVWALFALVCFPLLLLVRTNWKKLETEDESGETSPKLKEQLAAMFGAFRGSRFAMVLATTLFLVMNVTLLCEYQYLEVLSEKRSEAELAQLFGQLFFYVNIFNLAVNLFLFNRLVGLFGVRNVALIQPVSYLAVFAFFLVARSPAAGIAGFFAYHGLLTSIDYNNTNFLLNALPATAKKQLRTFIEGLCEPMASAVMGLFLVFLVKWLSPEQLSALGMSAAAIALICAFVLRSEYVSAMVGNLKRGWLDFSLPPPELARKLSAADVEQLRHEIASFNLGRSSIEEHLTALRLLRYHDRPAALDALLHLFEQLGDKELPEAEKLLGELLGGKQSELIQRVLLWLEEQKGPVQSGVLAVLGRWGLVPVEMGASLLAAEETRKNAAGCVVAYSGHRVVEHAECLAALEKLFAGDEEAARHAITVLGRIGTERYAHMLADYLQNESAPISRAALDAIFELCGPQSTRLVDPLLKLMEDADEPRRLIAMECLAKIADSGSLSRFLAESQWFSPAERRQAERVFLAVGLKAIPACVSVLTDAQQPYAARSIAARALAKLSFAQLESLAPELIEYAIRSAYAALVNRTILSAGGLKDLSPGIKVLTRYYRDREALSVEFILELLTLSGRVASFELLSASLRSTNLKQRADAIETLQQACSREVFRLFGPLLDSRREDQRKKIIRKMVAAEKLDRDAVVRRALESPWWLEAACAAQALWDDGASDAKTVLQRLLRQNPASRRTPVIMSLLARTKAGVPAELNIIERMDALVSCRFFEEFSVNELHILARDAKCGRAASGETIFVSGDEAFDLFVLCEGAVELNQDGVCRTLGTGAIFGHESIFGSPQRLYTVEAKEAAILTLPSARILDRAALNARIAGSLLGHKLGAADAT